MGWIIGGIVCILVGIVLFLVTFGAQVEMVCRESMDKPVSSTDWAIFKKRRFITRLGAIILIVIGIWCIVHGM